MTEQLHFHYSLSCTGEGNGNPLQYSCLENPRDRRAWWAAVTQSWTRLKRLSSSSTSGQESLRRNGVAMIVNKRVQNAVLGCNLKNERMISVCFQGKPFNIIVIQVYAPTSNAEEAEVERFYEDVGTTSFFSSCIGILKNDRNFRLPLGLALGSPIFNSSCDGKLGVLLESLQGQRDLIEACVQDLIFLSREDRDLGFPFQTPPGSQASPRGEAEDSTFLSSRDTDLLEPNEWTQGCRASSSVWREDSGLLSRPGRKRRPSARDDGGVSWVSSLSKCHQFLGGMM